MRSEDVIKLPKGDFFVPKLPVFSITFGRKTKKSQPSQDDNKSAEPDDPLGWLQRELNFEHLIEVNFSLRAC
jgi:hypothetical protein